MKYNKWFGETVDRQIYVTDKRSDQKPRLIKNKYNDDMLPDKTKFLAKFSCFDGFMQTLDHRSNTRIDCHGLGIEDFKQALALEVNSKANESVIGNHYDENFIQ